MLFLATLTTCRTPVLTCRDQQGWRRFGCDGVRVRRSVLPWYQHHVSWSGLSNKWWRHSGDCQLSSWTARISQHRFAVCIIIMGYLAASTELIPMAMSVMVVGLTWEKRCNVVCVATFRGWCRSWQLRSVGRPPRAAVGQPEHSSVRRWRQQSHHVRAIGWRCHN